ncbi:MAG: ribonuclease HII [Candidatus Paceibacterota bacterium]|jgi:ribonuclease HII
MIKESKDIVGIDEAGRGPLAGPVVAAAVLDLPKRIKGVKDSKLLSEKKREELYSKIINNYKWGIGIVSPKRIDKINILEATKEAMIKAVRNLEKKNKIKSTHLILDGNMKIDIDISQESIIGADRKIYCVSAASIIAKVTRDRLMIKYDKLYPEYNFKKHKGYGTREHFKLIQKYGGCKIHRKSFKPFDKDK